MYIFKKQTNDSYNIALRILLMVCTKCVWIAKALSNNW